jgi:hypothetical protein
VDSMPAGMVRRSEWKDSAMPARYRATPTVQSVALNGIEPAFPSLEVATGAEVTVGAKLIASGMTDLAPVAD